MKVCPNCERRYEEETLRFCTIDGNLLLGEPEIRDGTTELLPPARYETKRNKQGVRRRILVYAVWVFLTISVCVSLVYWPGSKSTPPKESAEVTEVDDTDEPSILIDKALVSLDLTRDWMELNEQQRKGIKASKGVLLGQFVVRRRRDGAKLGHRLGTTSAFKPEWSSTTHPVEAKEDNRKCSPEVKYSVMLYFDLDKEGIDIPFNLAYEIDFWNAHNGEKGDWQSFYVGHPTEKLTMKVAFPKNKPYTRYFLKAVDGKDCNARPEPYPNPKVRRGIDPETGARTISWTIEAPKVHWIYRIEWSW